LRQALAVAVAAVALVAGCKRAKPPLASRLWLGPSTGCVEVKNDGSIACWGANEAGQIGDGTTVSRPVASKLELPPGKLADLALGARHACAVIDGTVTCWGDGKSGQLGAGGASSPRPAKALEEKAISIAVGGALTCALLAGGRDLRCFGANDEGQLGEGGWSRGAAIKAFAVGEAHTCVAYEHSRTEKAYVVCRGRAVAAPREPILVAAGVKELAAGAEHTCALLEDATVRCWGRNDAGQLGDGSTNDATIPVSPVELSSVAQIAAGRRHTCALLENGTVACWGANDRHQLANGTTEGRLRPGLVVGIVRAREIAAAEDGTCVRLDGGYVRCWGANDRGQLGTGEGTEVTVPASIRSR
jgi:alpha-tubulin suppressor-like RCC1 family protein